MELKQNFLTKNNCYTANQWIKPTKIMLHSTACPGIPAKNFLSSWNREFPKGQGKCVAAFVDPGVVYQTLPWTMRAWGCGGTGNNVAIQFEICEPKDYADEEYFKQIKWTVLELVAYLCVNFNINIADVTSHCEAHKNYGSNFASNHSDLDHWWKAYFNYTMDDFRKELYEYMANEEKLKQLGITRFHECGYKGAGIVIASRENNKSEHGASVEDVIRQIVPESIVVLKENYQKGTDADIYTTSLFSESDRYSRNMQKAAELYEKNVFLVCAVGNEGEESQTELSKSELWTSIGACDLVKGKPQRMYYSSVTPDIDFMSFTNMLTSKGKFTGTSCATPVFASMCVLAQQFFKTKCGRKLTNHELLKFIKDNCLDMLEEGPDTKTGYGLFVLPDPDKIDVKKYIEGDNEMDERYGYKVYNDFEALPNWGKDPVQRAIDMGILKGTGKGLGLTETELKTIVWLDRLGLFNKPNPQEDEIILPPKK